MLIGGELVAGTGAELAVENPFDESTVATVALPGPDQVDAAVAAAAAAQRGWAATPAGERGEMLHEVASRLRAAHRRARAADDARGRQAAGREP